MPSGVGSRSGPSTTSRFERERLEIESLRTARLRALRWRSRSFGLSLASFRASTLQWVFRESGGAWAALNNGPEKRLILRRSAADAG